MLVKPILSESADRNNFTLFFIKDKHWTDLSTEKFGKNSLESLASKERKRFEAVWELFHAEVTYITDHLLVLKEASQLLSFINIYIVVMFCVTT